MRLSVFTLRMAALLRLTASAWVIPTLVRRDSASAFVTITPSLSPSALLSSTTTGEELFVTETKEAGENKAAYTSPPSATSTTTEVSSVRLPWWWKFIWRLPMMKQGEPGTDIVFGDKAHVLRSNVEQFYWGFPSLDGCPTAQGVITDISKASMLLRYQNYLTLYGSPYKLCFGPKSFLVVSDAVQAKHVLREANSYYDKGVLSEILKPIMGNGLVAADPQTWSVGRRQIVPAFHKAWLEHMVGLFGYCNVPLIDSLNQIIENEGGKVDMEEKFCSVALDIIGKSVFNYEFGSIAKESPVIKAVYGVLLEAVHRSVTPVPYWNLPLTNQLVPHLRKFNADLKLLNKVLDGLISQAKNTQTVEDITELEQRNYDQVQDPSLLRFLVDMLGADIDNKRLRDDLMTLLIAGHETTASVLTWGLYELTRHPECLQLAHEEIDRVVGDRIPTYEDIKGLDFLRLVVAETLRMYPEPPLLMRRCRTLHDIPAGAAGRVATVIRGTDIFLVAYSIHRDERYWPNPNTFDPLRFTRPYKNPDCPEWEGYDPKKWEGKLYPTEIAADFAYLPFGGGPRKCVGDEFATLEATVTLAMLLRRFDFDFDTFDPETSMDPREDPQDSKHPVGMQIRATIGTINGLNMIVKPRQVN